MKEYKITFVGTQAVGKTTLISQYVYNHVEETYNSTVGIDFLQKIILIDNKKIRLKLWDTAGQERFNSLIKTYSRNSYILVVVFDLSTESTLRDIDRWIEKFYEKENMELIIAGNKKDKKINEDKFTEAIFERVKKYNAHYVECTALEKDGIVEFDKCIFELIRSNYEKTGDGDDVDEIFEITQKNSWWCF